MAPLISAAVMRVRAADADGQAPHPLLTTAVMAHAPHSVRLIGRLMRVRRTAIADALKSSPTPVATSAADAKDSAAAAVEGKRTEAAAVPPARNLAATSAVSAMAVWALTDWKYAPVGCGDAVGDGRSLDHPHARPSRPPPPVASPLSSSSMRPRTPPSSGQPQSARPQTPPTASAVAVVVDSRDDGSRKWSTFAALIETGAVGVDGGSSSRALVIPPLQLAVAARDLKTVAVLLAAGAQVRYARTVGDRVCPIGCIADP
jgi:hypothetical protein